MSQALSYPWIDVRNEAWLKTALLYWDSVRTIVPTSIEAPYSTNTGRALQDAGFLVPLRVRSGMDEIEDLAGDVLTYLGTAEGADLLLTTPDSRGHDVNGGKLPYDFGRLSNIHPEKLPYEMRRYLEGITAPTRLSAPWLQVNEKFGNFYMTLLASRLAERIGAQLVTSLVAADRLAVTARFDAQLNRAIPSGVSPHRWREYEAFNSRRQVPRHLAPGMLASLAIERMGVAPDTPIKRLIRFREQHGDELARFRMKVEQLASSVEANLTVEALREHVSTLYADEVVPALADLKAALRGRRIKWLSGGLLKIAFLSAASSTPFVTAGLAVPTALLAGAGISLIATGAMYNVDKRETLRTNPFAYLLSVERKLARSRAAYW